MPLRALIQLDGTLFNTEELPGVFVWQMMPVAFRRSCRSETGVVCALSKRLCERWGQRKPLVRADLLPMGRRESLAGATSLRLEASLRTLATVSPTDNPPITRLQGRCPAMRSNSPTTFVAVRLKQPSQLHRDLGR